MEMIAEKAIDLWRSMGRETKEVDFFSFLEGFRNGHTAGRATTSFIAQAHAARNEREAIAAWLNREARELFREGDARYTDYVQALAAAIRRGEHHETLQDASRQESTPGEEVKGDSVTSMPEVKPPGGTSG